jgi:hypothetical protein
LTRSVERPQMSTDTLDVCGHTPIHQWPVL